MERLALSLLMLQRPTAVAAMQGNNQSEGENAL